LSLRQGCVDAIQGHKFCIRALLDDVTLIQNQNQIGRANGTQSVGDDKARATEGIKISVQKIFVIYQPP
jgi:hypothetical protein